MYVCMYVCMCVCTVGALVPADPCRNQGTLATHVWACNHPPWGCQGTLATHAQPRRVSVWPPFQITARFLALQGTLATHCLPLARSPWLLRGGLATHGWAWQPFSWLLWGAQTPCPTADAGCGLGRGPWQPMVGQFLQPVPEWPGAGVCAGYPCNPWPTHPPDRFQGLATHWPNPLSVPRLYVCMCVCVCVCRYVYACMYVCMNACDVCIYVFM